jgi:hypothetical protein
MVVDSYWWWVDWRDPASFTIKRSAVIGRAASLRLDSIFVFYLRFYGNGDGVDSCRYGGKGNDSCARRRQVMRCSAWKHEARMKEILRQLGSTTWQLSMSTALIFLWRMGRSRGRLACWDAVSFVPTTFAWRHCTFLRMASKIFLQPIRWQ